MEKNIVDYKQEILTAIDKLKLTDVFVKENIFQQLYRCDLYIYIRISTEKQEFGRQLIELYDWAKKKDLTICVDFIYCDKFTGKSLKRDSYEKLRKAVKENDYIYVSEVSRLGRNWDEVKKEWYKLKSENINLLVGDFGLLSSPLPNEENEDMTVDKKFIQELTFNGVLYAACKKIEEVSNSTKAGLKRVKATGIKLGRPTSEKNNFENFLNTLRVQLEENVGQRKACLITRFPFASYQNYLKEYYNRFNTKDLSKILKNLEQGGKQLWL